MENLPRKNFFGFLHSQMKLLMSTAHNKKQTILSGKLICRCLCDVTLPSSKDLPRPAGGNLIIRRKELPRHTAEKITEITITKNGTAFFCPLGFFSFFTFAQELNQLRELTLKKKTFSTDFWWVRFRSFDSRFPQIQRHRVCDSPKFSCEAKLNRGSKTVKLSAKCVWTLVSNDEVRGKSLLQFFRSLCFLQMYVCVPGNTG